MYLLTKVQTEIVVFSNSKLGWVHDFETQEKHANAHIGCIAMALLHSTRVSGLQITYSKCLFKEAACARHLGDMDFPLFELSFARVGTDSKKAETVAQAQQISSVYV